MSSTDKAGLYLTNHALQFRNTLLKTSPFICGVITETCSARRGGRGYQNLTAAMDRRPHIRKGRSTRVGVRTRRSPGNNETYETELGAPSTRPLPVTLLYVNT